MDGIDAVSQGLFFSVSPAASQAASAQKTNKKEDVKKSRKVFSSAMEKAREEQMLANEGLPPEIAGMESEEAVIFLKDAADIAADKLRQSPLPENFVEYKKTVSQFMRYLVKNNFEVVEKRRRGKSRTGKPLDPHKQIVVINEKLDEMGRWLISSHRDTIEMLRKLNEIDGLLVDLIAA